MRTPNPHETVRREILGGLALVAPLMLMAGVLTVSLIWLIGVVVELSRWVGVIP